MMIWVISHEPLVRLGFFFGVFVVMAIWELVEPRRRLKTSKGARWFANLGILVFDALVVRVLFPAAAVGTAILAADRGWGLLNNFDLPPMISIVASITRSND